MAGRASRSKPGSRAAETRPTTRRPPAPPAARVDLQQGEMTLRVEGLALDRPLRVRAVEVTFLFPLQSSVVDVEVAGVTLRLDRVHFGIAPKARAVRLVARAPGARVLLATASPALIARVVELYRKVNMDGPRLGTWLGRPQLLPRTVWVNEIVHRYLFERQVCAGFDNDATRFLEAEIVKECYFLLRDRDDGTDRASLIQEHSPVVARALSFIDANLFEAPGGAALARAVGASESTLLRAFKRELGCTPSAYWRMRRLDEALVLLESGRHTVSEVGAAVGYDNMSAFAHAFAARFGRSPSELIPR